jgi:hypothetical protein
LRPPPAESPRFLGRKYLFTTFCGREKLHLPDYHPSNPEFIPKTATRSLTSAKTL